MIEFADDGFLSLPVREGPGVRVAFTLLGREFAMQG